MDIRFDQDQIRRAVSGDRAALERLLLDSYDPLRIHIAARMPPAIQSATGVDDIVQQVFSQVFRDLSDFQWRDESSWLAWLKTIADNRIRDALRAQRGKKRGGEFQRLTGFPEDSVFINGLIDEYAVTTATPSREAARHEAVQAIQVALATLPDEYAAAVRLRYFDELTIDDIATRLGKTTGAVRGLLDRARHRLREALRSASRYLSRR